LEKGKKTMQVLYAVDRVNDHKQEAVASLLFKAMQFPNVCIDITHVSELPQFPLYAEYGFNAAMMADVQRANDIFAQELTTEVAVRFIGTQQTTSVLNGFATDQLLEHADETKTDLIVCGGPHHSAIGALFLGSVARGLTISATCSLLIAKGKSVPTRPLKAVLATDHSPYMERAIKKLLELAPQGIEEITVVSAYNEAQVQALATYTTDLPHGWADMVRKTLQEKNEAVCEMLKPLGATCHAQFVDATVREAIAQTMQETGADILIMGAQGHGFVDRLTLGSTSFHEVMASPYSVLLLRP
jgi:nucleotide-binding universal stress UspA family protein